MPRKPQPLKTGTSVIVIGRVARAWIDEHGREMVTVVIEGTGHRETMPVDERYVRLIDDEGPE